MGRNNFKKFILKFFAGNCIFLGADTPSATGGTLRLDHEEQEKLSGKKKYYFCLRPLQDVGINFQIKNMKKFVLNVQNKARILKNTFIHNFLFFLSVAQLHRVRKSFFVTLIF